MSQTFPARGLIFRSPLCKHGHTWNLGFMPPTYIQTCRRVIGTTLPSRPVSFLTRSFVALRSRYVSNTEIAVSNSAQSMEMSALFLLVLSYLAICQYTVQEVLRIPFSFLRYTPWNGTVVAEEREDCLPFLSVCPSFCLS